MWCGWHRAVARNEQYKHDYSPLPNDVLKAIMPIYSDLSKDALLERCVGGFNQNNNESYNQLIWKISPKIISCGSTVVKTAAYIAACTFNEGMSSLLTIMSTMGVSLGRNAHDYARKEDELRVGLAERKAQQCTREARILRRQQQIDVLDAATASEDLLYGPGINDSM